uniref:2-oxo-4-hydroxy-4-carboxy-5-ureidoimidazoline decarboxylase n=1 Tax=Corethrella appendiculata TaxID=1370023 RepID=U5EXQ5_9DIPT
MKTKLSLQQVNDLSPNEFHQIFINVIECWSEGAIYVSALVPFKNFDRLIESFHRYLDQLSIENKLKILRLHPDLAGKLADDDLLTDESKYEQSCAGLDLLTAENKLKMNELNYKYKQKFSFPFVICVRENSKFEAILKGISERIDNEVQQEIEIGIGEVKKICRLRILEIVDYSK